MRGGVERENVFLLLTFSSKKGKYNGEGAGTRKLLRRARGPVFSIATRNERQGGGLKRLRDVGREFLLKMVDASTVHKSLFTVIIQVIYTRIIIFKRDSFLSTSVAFFLFKSVFFLNFTSTHL